MRNEKNEARKELEDNFDAIFPWTSDEAKQDAEYLRLRAEYVQQELLKREEILKAAGLR